ncbi:MAG: hypothetical protein IJ461_08985 [Clostridia bacterium]|nr:hypothetical protein [Clostridia bacterium]
MIINFSLLSLNEKRRLQRAFFLKKGTAAQAALRSLRTACQITEAKKAPAHKVKQFLLLELHEVGSSLNKHTGIIQPPPLTVKSKSLCTIRLKSPPLLFGALAA